MSRSLNGDMAAVADQCGEDVAEALIAALPGVRLYVPQVWQERGLLTRVAPEVAERLVEAFGGETIDVASPVRTNAQTFADLERRLDEGKTLKEAALEVGITTRHAMRVRQQEGAVLVTKRPDPRQLTLIREEDDAANVHVERRPREG